MIALFTDFGRDGPYVGQMHAVLAGLVPELPVIDLMHDAVPFRPDLAAPLLAAVTAPLPEGTVVCAVVDPKVGMPERVPVVVRAGGMWFVGPDNGLFDAVLGRAVDGALWRIDETRVPGARRPLSASFHGRDLFAPVAALLASNKPPPGERIPLRRLSQELAVLGLPRVVAIDRFGNAMTGLYSPALSDRTCLRAGGHALAHAPTFGAVPAGAAFWFRNSQGLAEIAVNRGSASVALGLVPGSAVEIVA